ncbi:hypothetical protein HDU93_009242 [Gonapodya sp. JEL0774]|nr:hypothetical protein HDU93_009242 [Gonapodya sp. JEL0774]
MAAHLPPNVTFSPRPPAAVALRVASIVHLLARWGIESAAATAMTASPNAQTFATSPVAARLNAALDSVLSSLYTNKLDQHLSRHSVNLYEAFYWRSRAQRVLDVAATPSPELNGTNNLKPARIPRALTSISRNIPSAITSASEILLSSGALMPSEVVNVPPTHPDYARGILRDFAPGTETPYCMLPAEQRSPFETVVETRLAAAGWCTGMCEWDVDADGGEGGGFAFVNPLSAIWKAEGDNAT